MKETVNRALVRIQEAHNPNESQRHNPVRQRLPRALGGRVRAPLNMTP